MSVEGMEDMRREGEHCSLPVREPQLLQLGDFGVSYPDFAWRVGQLLFRVSASLSLDYICLCLLSYLCLECVYLCSVSQSLEFICLSLLSTAFGLCLH